MTSICLWDFFVKLCNDVWVNTFQPKSVINLSQRALIFMTASISQIGVDLSRNPNVNFVWRHPIGINYIKAKPTCEIGQRKRIPENKLNHKKKKVSREENYRFVVLPLKCLRCSTLRKWIKRSNTSLRNLLFHPKKKASSRETFSFG